MTDFSIWYYSVPKFTRYWLSGIVGLSLLARFSFIPPQLLVLRSYLVFQKLQIWRLATSVFYYPINPSTGFHFMVNCYLFYQYSSRLERNRYRNSPDDYLKLLVINAAGCCVFGLFRNLVHLLDPLVLSVLYVWSKFNKDFPITWFGITFKGQFLPWILLGVDALLSSTGIDSITGIAVGHGYLHFIEPNAIARDSFWETPQLILKQFIDKLVEGRPQFVSKTLWWSLERLWNKVKSYFPGQN